MERLEGTRGGGEERRRERSRGHYAYCGSARVFDRVRDQAPCVLPPCLLLERLAYSASRLLNDCALPDFPRDPGIIRDIMEVECQASGGEAIRENYGGYTGENHVVVPENPSQFLQNVFKTYLLADDPQLLPDIVTMPFRRSVRDVKQFRYLLAAKAAAYHIADLDLSCSHLSLRL